MISDESIICYKLASKSRPKKLLACIENIREKSRHPHAFILVSLDHDDNHTHTVEFTTNLQRYLDWDHPVRLYVHYGTSGSKVAAINRDFEKAPHWDILVNTSDDMWFDLEGFDKVIVEEMKSRFPEGDGVLHFTDGFEPSRATMTLSIMDRRYYNRFGYIYHPDYVSLWSDVEATHVARKLGRHAFVDRQIVTHRHPANANAATDAQYAHTESFFWRDHAVFINRQAAGFP